MTYTLNAPIKSRKDNADHLITTLDVPAKITVGMMRAAQKNAPITQSLLFALDATAAWAGLDLHSAAKLETHDALGYIAAINNAGLLVSDNSTPLPDGSYYTSTMRPPEFKPVRAITSKITAEFNRPIEVACQILEAAGMDAKSLNELDVRELLPHVEGLVGAFINPKI